MIVEVAGAVALPFLVPDTVCAPTFRFDEFAVKAPNRILAAGLDTIDLNQQG